MATITMDKPAGKTELRGGIRVGKNFNLQKEISAKLVKVIEEKLEDLGIPESKFFSMIGANAATGCHLRKGRICKAENLVVICLALGINMNEFFGSLVPGVSNFLAIYEKKTQEARRYEQLAERARLELGALLKKSVKSE